MQSENFDNKVRQAAEQHHPNYDEKAWSKMEKLLNQHLPQKDDRRRIIFLLLFFLLAGGGAWLFISKPWNNQPGGVANTPIKNETTASAGSTKETTDTPIERNSPASERSADEKKVIGPVKGGEDSKLIKDKNLIATLTEVVNSSVPDKLLRRNDNKIDQLKTDITNPGTTRKDNNPSINNTNPVVSSPGNSNDKLSKDENSKTVNDQPPINDIPGNKTIETKKENVKEQSKKAEEKEIAKKSGNEKNNLFFFSFSAGPDISSVGFDHPGKVELLAGAGLGYTFKNRWTIRTGFYTARKIYTASKYDYKPSGGAINPNYLDEIDADCKVYEIPLNLSYNFSKSTKHSLFATAGLSSFIMKKEEYKYLYTYPGNPPTTYTHTKTLNNENKHYFSVLTLSGGYQRKINKTFSIAAEPYIKLPLAGIGFGNVKLNSAGILFSVNITPFQPAAKK
jgi:hypothetical protein